MPVDVAVIGGGPAGSAVAGLLASWGHGVVLLSHPSDPARGLAESIPPSTRKLLTEIGAIEAVERHGFYRSTGNTVWWASDEPRIERFSEAGYQVFRPEFDRVLLGCARASGADVRSDARVRAVVVEDERARLDYEEAGRISSLDCRLVVDCSGRAGVVARRFRRAQPGHRTTALIGVWRREPGWPFPDPTHTTVETFEHGWIWSVPISPQVRHVAAMVETIAAGAALDARYLDCVRRSRALGRYFHGGTLERVFACDASLYRSDRYAGPAFLLVGDAGSFIDPLSSFGVKKALASAWVGAVAAHTALIDAARRAAAFAFFEEWAGRIYDDYLRRSRDFARAAAAKHPDPFWTTRAGIDVSAATSDGVDPAEVHAAFERLKAADRVSFALAEGAAIEPRPVIRDREIVIEQSFGGTRFHEHVDLVTLAAAACRSRSVADTFEEYCRSATPVPLPNVLSALSLLVAKGVLTIASSWAAETARRPSAPDVHVES